ncbi:Gfo/Idh/MocA family protein [Microlunatus speluncae]|uniref:Gfo/Idh/MocA family protein n=1 Tax=Microlunatus speluncae TaxID=2594267 RepID=UPI001C2D3BB2|nr:Gfo/Idh/MocA family oxidoreductase [Microlunatus speluncae]
MATDDQLTIAVVGLGFGAAFVPIYQSHPSVAEVVICDPDRGRLDAVGAEHGIARRLTDYDEVLADESITAVHLVTPMPIHAEQSIAALAAGKHCACAVPMGMSVREVEAVHAAQRASGRNYMMMETAVYTREFLHLKEITDTGDLGAVQLLRGAHYSNYENWPAWKWYPPMLYATHALAPLLAISGTRVASVRCLGSGRMPARFTEPYGNPFPSETAIFELTGLPYPLAAEVTRTIFATVRQELESFDVYGERLGFEWSRVRGRPGLLHRLEAGAPEHGRHPTVITEELESPDRTESLPADLQPFVRSITGPDGRRRGGGHGGSHPHLVHEFVESIVAGRPPAIDARISAAWTLPGICAHESALAGGAEIPVPQL